MIARCSYAERWPELFARLPDEAARWRLSQSLANAHLDGWEPTREAVELLVDAAVGSIPATEFVAAVVAHARRTGSAADHSSSQ